MAPFLISLVLFVAAVPASAQWGEVPLSAPFYEHAASSQTAPSIASDGTNFLVVWNDYRSGRGDIYATRVSPRGAILDPTGIQVAEDRPLISDFRRFTTVIWSGSSYIILWTDQSLGPGDSDSVKIARVAADGSVIDPARTLIDDAYLSSSQSAATNGALIVVVYQRANANDMFSSPHFSVIDSEGALIVDAPIPQHPTNNQAVFVTSNGSEFLALWGVVEASRWSLHYVRINSNGAVIDESPRILADMPLPAMVASDGTDYLVFVHDLWVIRLDQHGDPAGPLHRVDPPGGVAHSDARVVWTGDSYLLVLADGGSIRAVELDRDGRATGASPIALRGTSQGLAVQPAVAATDGETLVAWNDSRFSRGWSLSYDVFGAVVNLAEPGEPDELLLSVSASRQTTPSIAFEGRNYLAAWSEVSGIYASRIGLDGRYLDGRGTLLSTPGITANSPRVVVHGTHYLVGWIEISDSFQLVLRTCLVDSSDGRIVSNSLTNHDAGPWEGLAISRGSDHSLVTWSDYQSGAIKAIRINSEGRSIDAVPLQISPQRTGNAKPSVAWNGRNWLVAWEEKIVRPVPTLGPPVYRMNIHAARISPELTLLDTQPIPIAISMDGTSSHNNLSVASDGNEFLVVWEETIYKGFQVHVRARHVAATGAVLEMEPLTIAPGFEPAAIWDGTRYLVAWQQHGISSVDIFASHLGRSDEPVSTAPFPVAASPTDESSVNLVTTGFRDVVAAYTRIAHERFYGGVKRAFARTITIARSRATRR